MAKKYTIIDLQGAGWWADTFTKPLSRAKIRNRFKEYPEYDEFVKSEHITNKDFTLDFIQEMWGCEITPATKGGK